MDKQRIVATVCGVLCLIALAGLSYLWLSGWGYSLLYGHAWLVLLSPAAPVAFGLAALVFRDRGARARLGRDRLAAQRSGADGSRRP